MFLMDHHPNPFKLTEAGKPKVAILFWICLNQELIDSPFSCDCLHNSGTIITDVAFKRWQFQRDRGQWQNHYTNVPCYMLVGWSDLICFFLWRNKVCKTSQWLSQSQERAGDEEGKLAIFPKMWMKRCFGTMWWTIAGNHRSNHAIYTSWPLCDSV